MAETYLYEVLFRGRADGTISGQHVRRCKVFEIDGEVLERVQPAEPVKAVDVEEVIGEVCAAQAETIATLTASISEKESEIAALLEANSILRTALNARDEEITALQQASTQTATTSNETPVS